MTKTLFQTIVLLALCSCGQVNNTNPTLIKSTHLHELQDRFKYRHLKSFQTDSLDWESRRGHYREVDSVTFKLIFQEGDRQFIGQGPDRDYYYSWQNRDSNFIEFTILTQDESSYCDLLRYYIYDKTGKFISKFDIATECSDGGWTFSGIGKQTDKNQFTYNTVESSLKDGGQPEGEKYEVDSINYLITIFPSGLISRKEIYRRHISN